MQAGMPTGALYLWLTAMITANGQQVEPDRTILDEHITGREVPSTATAKPCTGQRAGKTPVIRARNLVNGDDLLNTDLCQQCHCRNPVYLSWQQLL